MDIDKAKDPSKETEKREQPVPEEKSEELLPDDKANPAILEPHPKAPPPFDPENPTEPAV
jgi:hypothetical protein